MSTLQFSYRPGLSLEQEHISRRYWQGFNRIRTLLTVEVCSLFLSFQIAMLAVLRVSQTEYLDHFLLNLECGTRSQRSHAQA